MRTGSANNQVYVPKLWYYSQLEFLNDQRQGKIKIFNEELLCST
nr:unnamed protein product [Callosobruchus analis]